MVIFREQVVAGEGRVIACLQDHVEDAGFPPTCYGSLKQHTAQQQKRLSLNPHANKTCARDVARLCPRQQAAVQQGGVGDVACLVRANPNPNPNPNPNLSLSPNANLSPNPNPGNP